MLGRKDGEDMNLITYVTDRKGHDKRYAIDSRKLQRELGWEPSLQFEEGIEKPCVGILTTRRGWITLLPATIRGITTRCTKAGKTSL